MRNLLVFLLAIGASANYAEFASAAALTAEHASSDQRDVLWKAAIVCTNTAYLDACHDVLLGDSPVAVKIVLLIRIVVGARAYFPSKNARFAEYADAVRAVDHAMYLDAVSRREIETYAGERERLWHASFACAQTTQMEDCHDILVGDGQNKVDEISMFTLFLLIG